MNSEFCQSLVVSGYLLIVTMFYCQFCTFETVSLASHLNHHRYHTNITRYYYCGFMKCKSIFKRIFDETFITFALL
ncbi:hypothetical protein PUN28_017879 [Cardiocondyla obscurior]|uniref:Secreted protein n=1 Tax=Cardiocondyla obscurior TaxID=286306 RepID=A0AAW2EQ81_9HYME